VRIITVIIYIKKTAVLNTLVTMTIVLVRERSAIVTLIVSRRVCLWVCLSTFPHFQNAFSPVVLVGIS